jgi:hypothetical protein
MEALAELNNLRLLLDHPYLLQYDTGWEIVSDVSVRRSEAVWGKSIFSGPGIRVGIRDLPKRLVPKRELRD